MPVTAEFLLLYGSILVIFGLFLSKASFKLGMPTLLLFLGIGIFAGSGSFGIELNNPDVAQFIGVLALTVILFSGGMDTDFKDIRPVIGPGAALASIGVLITAVLTGTFIYYLFLLFDGISLTYPQALLCGAVMSSTDSASVFSILRSKSVQLKQRLKPTLEFESGSNDPMAFLLTILLIGVIQAGEFNTWSALLLLAQQLIFGTILGYVLGKVAVWMLNRFVLPSTSLYSILLLACSSFIFAATSKVGGNGYLAVYIAGLVVGNARISNKKTIANFFDGFAWLWQLIMFLTLGLLVNAKDLWSVAIPALLIGVFIIFIGRPLSVFLTLLPFPKFFTLKAKAYISWVGLRGAAPIIFATYPWLACVEHSQLIFHIVFFITLVSLLIQGGTVTYMADKLDLIDRSKKEKKFASFDLPDEIKSALSEIIVNKSMIEKGNKLKDLPLPDHTLALMIQRDGHYKIPKGNTVLKEGDHVLLISDDEEALLESYEELGITTYSLERNT